MEAERNQPLPLWIWHEDRCKKGNLVLSVEFELPHKIERSECRLALTGGASVELDGRTAGELPENPGNVVGYRKVQGFPETLEAGPHTLSFRIECTEPMPVTPVSIHLSDRRVGCSAFLAGDGFWLPTNEAWTAAGETAAVVCRYGEEPYGDLEGAPEWFVAGGYGDIATERLTDIKILDANLSADVTETGELRISGALAGPLKLRPIGRGELQQFYHLRKQNEWKELREQQRELDAKLLRRVRVDLKREYNARFRVCNRGLTAVDLLWNGAESPAELERYDSCITERFRVEPGSAFTTLPEGMRYVEIYVSGTAGAAADLEVVFERAEARLRQVGQLHSDHELLNRIYEVSAHTNRICHQLGLWDGVKRDRLNWAYDFYLAGKADFILWDDLDILRRSIREIGRGTPYGYWMNSIEAYTLWWMVGVWEYFWFTGDRSFLLDIRPDIRKHARWIVDNIDPATGFMKDYHEMFLEWVPMSTEESWLAVHALLAMTRQAMEQLNRYMPELDLPSDWRLPHIEEKKFLEGRTLIAPLLGIMSGYVGKEAGAHFLDRCEPADPMTPISAYWFAECCSALGMIDKAWRVVRQVWGGMLERDATTFWEAAVLSPASGDLHDELTTYTNYRSYRISLCHAWSSTPVQWISRFILGIEPVEPGYAKVRFQPYAIEGLTACSGRVHTPCGPLSATWRKGADGNWQTDLELPQGVELMRDEASPVGERRDQGRREC